MAMSSCEVVRRAIAFETPDRLPMRFEALPEFNDVVEVLWKQIGTGDRGEKHTRDEWGCTWARTDVPNMGQVKTHPLTSWDDFEGFQPPDPNDERLYPDIEAQIEAAGDKYCVTEIFMLLFERMHALRGFENTLMDLLAEPERAAALADMIVEYDLAIIRNVYERGGNRIHGFNFTDDWGTELDTFVSPALWDDFFKPRYKRIFDYCHEIGWHVWMHSCGKINGILESLIEIGCDVINLQQPRALGIEAIGERFAGRICFESLCDIQRTLPFEDADAIRAEAGLLLERWGTPRGGFILSDYGDDGAIGASSEKKDVMVAAFRAAAPWRTGVDFG